MMTESSLLELKVIMEPKSRITDMMWWIKEYFETKVIEQSI